MPTYILKPRPDRDFYVAWSTVVDSPVAWGDRSQMVDVEGIAVERLDRADETGTSIHDGYVYGWTDPYPTMFIRELNLAPGTWTIERVNLESVCLAIETCDSTALHALLSPIGHEA